MLLHNGEDTAKGIIFCQYCKECSQLYLLHKKELGIAFTSPVGASDLHRYRRVEMFTRCTETSLKEKIVASFADPASHLRIVIGTIAFGMGLDFPVSAMWSTLDLLQTLRVMSRRLDVVVGIESSVPPFCFIQKQTSSTRRRV